MSHLGIAHFPNQIMRNKLSMGEDRRHRLPY